MDLSISEHFYSIQGEGPTAGVPAVFVRLTGCNLMCGGQQTVKDGKLHDGATWRCDTIEVWLQGTKNTIDYWVQVLHENYGDAFSKHAHLVITGGEPLLHQKEVVELLKGLRGHHPDLWIEVETNGTIAPTKDLLELVEQFNISPKLSNSGMPHERRVKIEAINTFTSVQFGSFFKFVLSSKEDFEEAYETFIQPFHIDPHKVWLMPANDNITDMPASWQLVAELCKEHGYFFSPRLQVAIWDKTTGV